MAAIILLPVSVHLKPVKCNFDPKNHISAWQMDPFHLNLTKFGRKILLNPRNKLVEEFFFKSKMAAGGQKLNFDIISAQKSHLGLANGYLSSNLDKIWQADTIQP